MKNKTLGFVRFVAVRLFSEEGYSFFDAKSIKNKINMKVEVVKWLIYQKAVK